MFTLLVLVSLFAGQGRRWRRKTESALPKVGLRERKRPNIRKPHVAEYFKPVAPCEDCWSSCIEEEGGNFNGRNERQANQDKLGGDTKCHLPHHTEVSRKSCASAYIFRPMHTYHDAVCCLLFITTCAPPTYSWLGHSTGVDFPPPASSLTCICNGITLLHSHLADGVLVVRLYKLRPDYCP